MPGVGQAVVDEARDDLDDALGAGRRDARVLGARACVGQRPEDLDEEPIARADPAVERDAIDVELVGDGAHVDALRGLEAAAREQQCVLCGCPLQHQGNMLHAVARRRVKKCAAVVEHVAVEGEVRAERRRILVTLLEGLDELAERGVSALRAEIPAYGEGDERFVEDLRDQVRSHYRREARGAARGPDGDAARHRLRPRGGDAPGARRVRAGGLPQRLPRGPAGVLGGGRRVRGGDPARSGGRADARRAADALLRLRQHPRRARLRGVPAVHGRRRRPRAPRPARAPARRRDADAADRCSRPAQATASPPDSRMLVATAVTVDARADADAPHVGSAAIACAGLHDAKTLVVVRQTEIVAILVLGRGRRSRAGCAIASTCCRAACARRASRSRWA